MITCTLVLMGPTKKGGGRKGNFSIVVCRAWVLVHMMKRNTEKKGHLSIVPKTHFHSYFCTTIS